MIYLDYSSSTPVVESVLNKMLPYFGQQFGNASSRLHLAGWQAEEAVEESRKTISRFLGGNAQDIYFTSGATESINLVLRGIDWQKGDALITCRSEHKAVLDTCDVLAEKGVSILYANIHESGQIDFAHFESLCNSSVKLASVMAVNNETGVVQPIQKLSAIAKGNNIPFFCDATQAVGKMVFDNRAMNTDGLAFSAHKFYGPKGVGGLLLKKGLRDLLQTQISGGGQEHNLRSGSVNVPGIVGMAAAIEYSHKGIEAECTRMADLRNILWNGLKENCCVELAINGTKCLPHILNVQFGELDSESLQSKFNHQLCLSNGSACNSATVLPSHVLLAMGKSNASANASIRFSLGRLTTKEELRSVIQIVAKAAVELLGEQ